MTDPLGNRQHGPPSFRAAMENRKVQILTAGLAVAAIAALTAVAVQAQSAKEEGAISSRAQVEQIVHDYILDHPEILPQAMERLQAKRMSAAIDEKRAQIETPFAGSWEGAENGDVVLVEFFDYACSYCRASLGDITKLLTEDKKLKVVYRELPILSKESGDAAHVSLLAAEKGKYPEFHKALYAAGHVTKDSILSAAASVGIDRGAAQKAIADGRYDGEIEKNIGLAQSLGASGTPTFVVGNRVLQGAVGYAALKSAVEEARVRK